MKRGIDLLDGGQSDMYETQILSTMYVMRRVFRKLSDEIIKHCWRQTKISHATQEFYQLDSSQMLVTL